MPHNSANLQEWTRRLEGMKRCTNAAELVRGFGEPAHKVQHSQFEIWHYPLGSDAGSLHSIHVAVAGDKLAQVYMSMEPAAQSVLPGKTPWWKRLFGPPKPKPSDPMPALLKDPELYERICAATGGERRHAATVLARWMLERICFKHPVIDKALSQLASASPPDPQVAAAVGELADQLDLQDEELEANGQSEKAAVIFAQARAACCVRAALDGDAADAAYEAISATNDQTQVRQVVLAVLSKHENA